MNNYTTLTNYQKSIKSVPKLSAQYDTLCQPNEQRELVLDVVLNEIVHGSDYRLMERIMLDLMLSGGLRVSEVLNDSYIQANVLGQVYIRGLKGSDSKLVTPIYFKDFWNDYSKNRCSPFLHISRFSFYKYCRSLGIIIKHVGKNNNSVTHAMRHLHVYMMELIQVPENELSHILGHKRISNLKYYRSGR